MTQSAPPPPDDLQRHQEALMRLKDLGADVTACRGTGVSPEMLEFIVELIENHDPSAPRRHTIARPDLASPSVDQQ